MNEQMTNEQMTSAQTKSSLDQWIRTWAQGRTGRFLLTQLAHTVTTVVVLAALLLGAARVGALNNVLAPAAAVNDTSFTTINYQGRLADSGGAPIDNTNPGLGMTFALYNVESGGSPLWTETHANVPVAEGLFSVRLGSVNALNTDLLSDDLWLGIQVGTDPEMTPREKLAAVTYAMQAGLALTVPDGSITTAKIDIDGNVDLQGHWLANFKGAEYTTSAHDPLFLQAYGNDDGIRLIADGSIWMFIDANNDQTNKVFSILHNQGSFNSPVRTLLTVNENGDLSVRGSISHGALVENNLQTSEELAAERITRFSEGDVLCWGEGRLELCTQAGDPLVQAVADENGKPIVIGAEVVKVLGPVRHGDLLVASDVPGCAVVDNNPRPGTVIAQALEDFDPSTGSGRGGEQGLIRAMIRKF